MSIKQLIQEKFGYTADLPTLSKMHDDVQDREKAKDVKKADHPLEKYRNEIRALLGSMNPGEMVERIIDFDKMEALGKKVQLPPAYFESLAKIKAELDVAKTKQDRDLINSEWTKIKDTVPYWFFGMLGNAAKDPKMETTDEEGARQLFDWMEQFGKETEKELKAAAKYTPHADRDTAAKDNLDKARKEHKIDTDAGSEKKLKQKPENEIK